MLQLIDRQEQSVIELMKVKSVEYSLLALMSKTLLSAIERGEIETQFERLIQNYTKAHKGLLKQTGVNDKLLPHSDTYYFDLFMSAFTLVSQRRSPKEYQSHRSTLYSNQTKFFLLAMKTNEEKKKVYAGENIDFESHLRFETQ